MWWWLLRLCGFIEVSAIILHFHFTSASEISLHSFDSNTINTNIRLCIPIDHITSESANFESVLSLLSSFFIPEDENVLLAWVEKVMEDKKLRSSMHHWRAEWKRLVETGESAQALL